MAIIRVGGALVSTAHDRSAIDFLRIQMDAAIEKNDSCGC